MRRKLVSLALALALALSLTACGGNPPSDGGSSGSSSTSSSPSSALSSESSSDLSESSEPVQPAVQTVGQDGFGYVDIPSDWLVFQDANAAEGALQYCDPAGRAILTLYGVYHPEGDAEASAAELYATITGDGASDVTAATVSLGGSTAYQVYGYYESEDVLLVTWFLKTPDDYVRYVAIEAGKEEIAGWVDMVEASYRLEKAAEAAGAPEDLEPVPATIERPAGLGEWVETKRYSAQDSACHTVYVRITAVERGSETVQAEIDAYNAAGHVVSFEALEDDALEYGLMRYEVYFPDDFPQADWGITTVDLTFSITTREGGGIQDQNGTAYIGLSTVYDISENPDIDSFYAGSTFTGGKAVFAMVKGVDDYLFETYYAENDQIHSAYFAGQ